VGDGDVPLGGLPSDGSDGDEGMWIPDEDPPLAGLPKTGIDGVPSYLSGLLGLSVVGTGAMLRSVTRKRGKYEKC